MMLGNISMEHKSSIAMLLIDCFITLGDQEMMDTILNLADKYEWVKYEYNTYISQKKTISTYNVTVDCAEPVTIGTVDDFLFDTL